MKEPIIENKGSYRIVRYPLHWSRFECDSYAKLNDLPACELIQYPIGDLPWWGNILGYPSGSHKSK